MELPNSPEMIDQMLLRKEKYKIADRRWRENHRDELLAYYKDYNEKYFREKLCLPVRCECCDVVMKKYNLSQHKRSKTHILKQQLADLKKEKEIV